MKGWITPMRSYMPPIEPGDVMRSFSIGPVTRSASDRIQVGDVVTGFLGVQTNAVVDARAVRRCDVSVAPMELHLSVLGMTGFTGYFGMLDIGRPQPEQTVVVSAASGAVGSVAAQVAKRQRRAGSIGIAGGPVKCAYLTRRARPRRGSRLQVNRTVDRRSTRRGDSDRHRRVLRQRRRRDPRSGSPAHQRPRPHRALRRHLGLRRHGGRGWPGGVHEARDHELIDAGLHDEGLLPSHPRSVRRPVGVGRRRIAATSRAHRRWHRTIPRGAPHAVQRAEPRQAATCGHERCDVESSGCGTEQRGQRIAQDDVRLCHGEVAAAAQQVDRIDLRQHVSGFDRRRAGPGDSAASSGPNWSSNCSRSSRRFVIHLVAHAWVFAALWIVARNIAPVAS